MSSIAGIFMGCAGSGCAAAVALELSKPPRRSRLKRFLDSGWEVEVSEGKQWVVARNSRDIMGSALLAEGIEYAHRALDLLSVEVCDHLVTTAPADGHVIYERGDGKGLLRFRSSGDIPMSVEMEHSIVRADGTVEKPAPPAEPAWAVAFRFHRLSQVSRDLFDAYRNLFLAFEALLDQLFPKGRKEQEKLWLERAVGAAAARVDIPALGLDYVIDPVKEVVDRVYRIRVQLFHAKTGRTIVPEERVGYVAVAETYAELLRLWTAIARAWLGYHPRSGVITNAGFRQLIDSAYTGSRFAVTSDDTPPTKLDVDPSPQGLPVGTFGAPVVIDGAIHGAVTLRSRASLVELAPVTTVGRVCLLNREAQNMLATSMSGSLDLDGVAELEIECVLKLANIGQPRLDFG